MYTNSKFRCTKPNAGTKQRQFITIMAHYEILSNAMCHIVIYLLTGPPQLKMITAVSHL